MHLSIASVRKASTSTSNYAVQEIQSYIAIRDQKLVEAERMRTHAKLESVTIANDFVVSCLRPARSPYEAQSLPGAEAATERKRCRAIARRVTEMSAALG